MTTVLLGEYRNQNAHRNYPFADDVTLTDQDGLSLPLDFLIDAMIYPIDYNETGGLYLATLDLTDVNAMKMYFAAGVSGTVYGIATFSLSSDMTYVYEPVHNRQIGIVVFGTGIAQIFGGKTVREFVPAATELVSTVVCALNQTGVRAFELEDGTVVTGDVLIDGQDGIVITSYINMDGQYVLKFDVIGQALPTSEMCGNTCPTIKILCFHREPGSSFMISQYSDNAVSLASFGFSLDDICAAQKAQTLPDGDGYLPQNPKPGSDPCGPLPVPPPSPVPGPTVDLCFDIADCGGNFFLLTPSITGFTNAVGIKESDSLGKEALVHLLPIPVAADIDSDLIANQELIDPPLLAEGLVIFFKGLALYKRR